MSQVEKLTECSLRDFVRSIEVKTRVVNEFSDATSSSTDVTSL
jgi:hypothetical protein